MNIEASSDRALGWYWLHPQNTGLLFYKQQACQASLHTRLLKLERLLSYTKAVDYKFVIIHTHTHNTHRLESPKRRSETRKSKGDLGVIG